MRYYHFSLGISAQAIRENEELGRHWNSYEETLEVINEYMTKNLRKVFRLFLRMMRKSCLIRRPISSSWMTTSSISYNIQKSGNGCC